MDWTKVKLDSEHEHLKNAYAWRLVRGYVVSTFVERKGSQKKYVNIYLHRLICPSPVEVDHINGDRLDNRSCNLRIATVSQNRANASLRSHNSSGFKGVVFRPRDGVWEATIIKDKESVYLGRFLTREAAARAYDQAATRLHGQFAKTNKSMGLI